MGFRRSLRILTKSPNERLQIFSTQLLPINDNLFSTDINWTVDIANRSDGYVRLILSIHDQLPRFLRQRQLFWRQIHSDIVATPAIRQRNQSFVSHSTTEIYNLEIIKTYVPPVCRKHFNKVTNLRRTLKQFINYQP